MFEIYKGRKWTYLIPVVLFWGATPILLYVIVKDMYDKGFSGTTVAGVICTCMVALFGYMFFAMSRIDPYENIKKLQRENWELVARMEADFNVSNNLCPHIWKGREFYFFEGSTNLLVVPIGYIQSFTIRKGYSRSIGPHYDCHVKSSFGEADFAVAIIIKGSANLINVARDISAESGIYIDLPE